MSNIMRIEEDTAGHRRRRSSKNNILEEEAAAASRLQLQAPRSDPIRSDPNPRPAAHRAPYVVDRSYADENDDAPNDKS
jgi:hypothetical protein